MTRRLIVGAFGALELLAIVVWLASAAGVPNALLLSIAAIEVAIGGAVFMELAHAHPVMRGAAVVVLFFIALLCSGVAGDVALR